MTKHLTDENLDQYRRRTLPPGQLLAADDHIAACERCRGLAPVPAAGSAISALTADLRTAAQFEVDHLSFEQMATYVDRDLDDAERGIVESHLVLCSMCSDEIHDLRAFTHTAQQERLTTSHSIDSSGFWPSLSRFRLWPVGWTPSLVATAAGLLIFASVGVVLLYVWKSTNSSRSEVATTKPSEVTQTTQPSTDNSAVPLPSPTANPSPIVMVSLDDGGQRVTLDEHGNLEGLGPMSPSTQRALKTALTDGHVQTPAALVALIGKSGLLMSDPSDGVAFPLIGPVGTIVRTDRPTLRWRPLAGAQSYTVTLLDSSPSLIATSLPLTATEWTIPHPLKRGQTYVWQVTALKDNAEVISPTAPAPEARFKILESAQVTELRRVEASYRSSHLTRGLSYAQAGLLDDAEREFRALLAANPQSDVARKLLRNLEARRRRN